MSTGMMETKRDLDAVQTVVSVNGTSASPVYEPKRGRPGIGAVPAAVDGAPDVNPLFGSLLTVALQPAKCRCS